MTLDLQKIRERVEEAIDLTSQSLVTDQVVPAGWKVVHGHDYNGRHVNQFIAPSLFALLDSLHCLNVLEREERARFPIVTAEVPNHLEQGAMLDVVDAACDLVDLWEKSAAGTGYPLTDKPRALQAAVHHYRKVKQ